MQKEQTDNLQAGNCVERTVSHLLRVSLIHRSFHEIIVLTAIPYSALSMHQTLYQVIYMH